ncbi:cell wall hydrolase [Selenihalanaerobacter shriftii]|uniref:N-acetylmuramoyl-L-alanine amidase n=1 Tax=Selenihalanaerobacter shriftii TaxID=142842 RepID=A0A1T4QKX5_9FIRM|nr:cell wall hydrolase [Selenihalanaerobacter shriftii]SKA04369.1 N-acetylmuramoyl-L-alanine amidase [Selenihalanaerobacter shriftii]
MKMRTLSRYHKLLIFLIIILLVSIFIEKEGVKASSNYDSVLGARSLRYGDEGVDVAGLQIQLRVLGYYDGGIDGLFGKETVKAIKKFQSEINLKPDGIVGQKTFNSLEINNYFLQNNFSKKQVMTLASAINGEARGESYRGQVAVGAVILNRVDSDKFPNSIEGVIYDERQFTSVADGQIKLSPTETSIKAAEAALMGYDPTSRALFFYNPKIATKVKWISSRPVVVKIDNHVFAD